MVCLGNICRSPLAQGILEAKVLKLDLDWEVDSAGTGAWHAGEKPDSRGISKAKQEGIDISKQRARQFQSADFQEFDLILAMDASNYQNVLKLAVSSEERDKVKMMMNFAFRGENRAVPDPYYDGGFDNVYSMLDQACEGLIQEYAAN